MIIPYGGSVMKKISGPIEDQKAVLELMNIALEHEWAVSLEYLIHAYSMAKGKHFYEDPIMQQRTDVRAQTIQIGIDEMYHSLQLGIVITQMGGEPSFRTDEVIRFPRVIDNLKRDKRTEDLVTDLYQNSAIKEGFFPEVRNMVLNISYDEVRHSRQFRAMIEAVENSGGADDRLIQADPGIDSRDDVRLVHEIMTLENDLMHRYLRSVILFSGHQDLSQRLFKNSIDHMRHWDKNAGALVRLGTVMRLENAARGAEGEEVSRTPMPAHYPKLDRRQALGILLPAERALVAKYEALLACVPPGDMHAQWRLHLALKREHVFTLEWLLENAGRVPGLK